MPTPIEVADFMHNILLDAMPNEIIMDFAPDQLDRIMVENYLKHQGFEMEVELDNAPTVKTQRWMKKNGKYRVDVRWSERKGFKINVFKSSIIKNAN